MKTQAQVVVMHGPLMMGVDDFAHLHGVSKTTAWECINGTSKNYPPLKAKITGGGKQRVYITAEAAAEWRARLADR
ncbi:hypothetical protein [Schaalia sp. lx-260]|uniref:hypothetical protein n=1 Tax=Schaalia sp. lx-260 TaxID=2899082 RepID=UPI001E4386A8|nr:hypothetical protein [Schaalia sp. lx-260]MCD4549698.1 hypothetical protein [Schaalia sp. lx-260]